LKCDTDDGLVEEDGAWIADRPINRIDELSLGNNAGQANSNIGGIK